ncbi:hypothetical protein LTR36_008440 [Oleoguttula mirabilis]|uniref:Proteophosphoglycan 5 n=1 Tax=Oleoguttula mirabilis TaxID=1507867 RepID=A0AAV9J7G4_9PEZI|nr:hypothetical protein LTR36_008440 [Oleoguttula mirabilis]
MAELTNGLPQPRPDAGQGKNEHAPTVAQGLNKRTQRSRKNYTQSLPQIDGTVSDSVTNPTASPRSKKQPKQRQSVAAALPNQNSNMGQTNGQQPRPISVGGPMLPAIPATPAKEQAYAGPTFQASPAPSSLPVPRFFSRSVPNAAAQPSLQARMEGEGTPEKQESSPEPDVVEPVSREAQQSPLDLLFHADKAEKRQSRSGSNMLSPEMATRRLPATEPRNPFQQGGRSIFLRELDGDSEDMPSPRTILPIRPAPAERAHSSPGVRPQSPQDEVQREAYTRSLKDLLFNNVNGAAGQSATPPQAQQRAQSDAQVFSTPSPFHRSESGPNTPAPSTEQQNHYALHYGNRNLSPLFKATRNETPTKPSGLRQELPNGGPAQVSQAQQPPRQVPQIDSSSFSRSYLDQQIRSAQHAPLPQFPFTNGASSNGSSASFSGPSGSSTQQGVQAGYPGSTTSPRTSGPRDIRSMEDDLRRMLKLNVLG